MGPPTRARAGPLTVKKIDPRLDGYERITLFPGSGFIFGGHCNGKRMKSQEARPAALEPPPSWLPALVSRATWLYRDHGLVSRGAIRRGAGGQSSMGHTPQIFGFRELLPGGIRHRVLTARLTRCQFGVMMTSAHSNGSHQPVPAWFLTAVQWAGLTPQPSWGDQARVRGAQAKSDGQRCTVGTGEAPCSRKSPIGSDPCRATGGEFTAC